jgi:hypothetical protein
MSERDHVILELDGREVRFSNPDKVFFPARGEPRRVQPSKARKGSAKPAAGR